LLGVFVSWCGRCRQGVAVGVGGWGGGGSGRESRLANSLLLTSGSNILRMESKVKSSKSFGTQRSPNPLTQNSTNSKQQTL
jgi:hypothetical protein